MGGEESFRTRTLPMQPDTVAPDGSDVRLLLEVDGGGLAHFELAPGRTSVAVTHRTVEEIWYFLRGHGEMWRRRGPHEEVVEVLAGICVTIPLSTHFQFRAFAGEPLAALGATIPRWPGEEEAIVVDGPWEPTAETAAGPSGEP